MDYRLYIFRVPSNREDDIAAELWRLGSLGFEVKPGIEPGFVRLEAYFSDLPETASTIEAWQSPGVQRVQDSTFAERDWLADYRAVTRPFAVGERFFVAPGEPDDPIPEIPEGRILIRAPAQNAFGTGSHESTRLVMDHLERLDLQHKEILDVGTGSGILAFASLKLGASRVVGLDLDAPSVVTAAINAQRNQCRPTFLAGTAAMLKHHPCFDLLLVNVLPERVLKDYPRLLGTLKPEGQVISSGNLLSRRDELLDRFGELGLQLELERSEADWTSFLLRLTPRLSTPSHSAPH